MTFVLSVTENSHADIISKAISTEQYGLAATRRESNDGEWKFEIHGCVSLDIHKTHLTPRRYFSSWAHEGALVLQ